MPAVQTAVASPGPVGRVPALDLFVIRRSNILVRWISAAGNRHRALAYGVPERCYYSYHTYGFGTPSAAGERALDRCLAYVAQLSEFAGQECGCRLAVIDDRLLVSPVEMPQERFAPFALMVREPGGQRSEITGVASVPADTGVEIPLFFYNTTGREVCRGHYTISLITVVLGNGCFELNCFGGAVSGSGQVSIDVELDGRPVAIARGAFSDGTAARFVIGYMNDSFHANRRRQRKE